jgi:UDP-N-acetylglucosamine 2-epimerase (non-hydrolysing)
MKLLIVAGARPNFMKVAPLIHAAVASNGRGKIDWKLVHTGQHYDVKMSQVFFEELRIPQPDISLEVGSGSHAVQTARIMEKFEPVCLEHRPDWVVVVGDVNSTVACALVASKLGIKVAHVEAGLRSFDRTMPEEINRLVTDAIADLLLTPSEDGSENLRREGIPDAKIRMVGNIMMDCLVENLDQSRNRPILRTHGLEAERFIYLTLHRPANVDHREGLTAIMNSLARLATRCPVAFPVHPRTRKMLAEFGLTPPPGSPLRLIEPVGYHDSLCLTENARLVLTDSGGLQEESTFFRTPCLTLRPNTERPVTISIGSNRLTSIGALESDVIRMLDGPRRLGAIPPLWEGRTAGRILDALAEAC